MDYLANIDFSHFSEHDLYEHLEKQWVHLVHEESDGIANTANLSSLLYHTLPNVNWVGFYFCKNNELVLGPFQGKPACVRIQMGQGVCGTVAQKRQPLLVKDVHQFKGHITCDSASNSEIVLPLIKKNQLVGVLDIDSPLFDRFDTNDQNGLEKLISLLLQSSNF